LIFLIPWSVQLTSSIYVGIISSFFKKYSQLKLYRKDDKIISGRSK
jgi:hypothetical protein